MSPRKRRPRRPGTRKNVKVTWTKRPGMHYSGGERSTMKSVGTGLTNALEDRVVNKGLDADGKPIPGLSDDYSKRKGTSGRPKNRDGKFSGKMWRSIRVAVLRSGGTRDASLKISFDGKDNEHKARRMQFPKGRGIRSKASSRPEFILVAFTPGEQDKAAALLLKRMRFFK